jgi:hypothetical protein
MKWVGAEFDFDLNGTESDSNENLHYIAIWLHVITAPTEFDFELNDSDCDENV